ncbi:hypothetical protein XA68_13237 [Ophiocordyceps unilateralis]|uniref:CFEM domain-containing protein n=1 Tax=Ophiocordyceps unilateralis TaxID=268505 RepID=A0A2A9PMB3_OPHUN|nr:hypothetical protein XA68_13237 [Ophiocordyceps unilateralis]
MRAIYLLVGALVAFTAAQDPEAPPPDAPAPPADSAAPPPDPAAPPPPDPAAPPPDPAAPVDPAAPPPDPEAPPVDPAAPPPDPAAAPPEQAPDQNQEAPGDDQEATEDNSNPGMGRLPRCARTCARNMLSASEAEELGCNDGDFQCLCSNQDFFFGLRDCTRQNCQGNNVNEILQFGQTICQANDVPTNSTQFFRARRRALLYRV